MKELRRPVPSKVLYLWEKCGIRRIELFDGRTDLEKKPEIPRHTTKLPEIPTGNSFAQAHQRKLDEEERRRKKHHG